MLKYSSGSGTAVLGLVMALVYLVGIIGFVLNIVKIFSGGPVMELVLRIIGVVIPIVGAVAGYF